MQKSGNRKDDQVTAAGGFGWLVRNQERVGRPGNPIVRSFPRRDRQAVTAHDLSPALSLVSILRENANLDVRFRGSDSGEDMGAAACAADEHSNRVSHGVVDKAWLLFFRQWIFINGLSAIKRANRLNMKEQTLKPRVALLISQVT